MTDQCTIGPVSVAQAHLVDSDNYYTDHEEFEVVCTHVQFRQLLSLVEDNYTAQGSLGVTIISGTNPWTPTYINTASEVDYDDDMLIHKGWYVINAVTMQDMINMDYVQCKVTAIKISAHLAEYLTMDYTTGVNDGTALDSSYSSTTTNYLLNDAFTTFDTTNTWYAAQYDMAATPTIASDGSSLVFTGASGTAGQYKCVWTQTKTTYEAPFTMETDMTWSVRPAAGANPIILRAILSPKLFTSQASMNYDSIMIQLQVSATAIKYAIYRSSPGGTWTSLVGETTISASITTVTWKAALTAAGNITIQLDTGSGYTTKYSGPSLFSDPSKVYMGYTFYNPTTASKTMKTNFCTISQAGTQINNNVVAMPADATLVTAADFTRTSETGTISYYLDPTTQRLFTTSDPYDGCVKAYSTNNPTSTSRQVISKDEVPTPTTFMVKNGLIRLTTTATGVTVAYWNGSSYVDLNTFVIGTINLLKLIEVGPERVVFQANMTKWTIKRGQQYVVVEHPYTAMTYTIKDTYDHDGTTTSSPAANADITMTTLGHAEIYNSGDTYCMQIYKVDPTTIKSDSIPADELTGIGWYNATLASSSYSSKEKLPLQFPIQTEQHISIKQV